MTLATAVLLFLIVLIGIAAVSVCLQKKRMLCIACIELLSLVALALACYIGLTVLFVNAVQTQPPVP